MLHYILRHVTTQLATREVNYPKEDVDPPELCTFWLGARGSCLSSNIADCFPARSRPESRLFFSVCTRWTCQNSSFPICPLQLSRLLKIKTGLTINEIYKYFLFIFHFLVLSSCLCHGCLLVIALPFRKTDASYLHRCFIWRLHSKYSVTLHP